MLDIIDELEHFDIINQGLAVIASFSCTQNSVYPQGRPRTLSQGGGYTNGLFAAVLTSDSATI